MYRVPISTCTLYLVSIHIATGIVRRMKSIAVAGWRAMSSTVDTDTSTDELNKQKATGMEGVR